MPIDGETRAYTWDDIRCLILRDMGLDPKDRSHHEMWYVGGFTEPQCVQDECVRVTKYKLDFNARCDENVREKL